MGIAVVKLESERLFRMAVYILVIALVVVGTFFISEVFMPEGWADEHPYVTEFVPSSVATFMGVLLGLFLKRGLMKRREEDRSREMLALVRRELERTQVLAGAFLGNHLDTQVWDSMINSGDAADLAFDVQDGLFTLYSRIRAHNIETARLRDLAEAHRRNPTDSVKSDWEDATRRVSMKEHELVEAIKQTLASGTLEVKAS